MASNFTSSVFPGDTVVQERASFTLLAVFNFLQVFGFTAVVIVLLTAWLSPTVHRSAVWYSFMSSWLLFCLSYFLIAGQQVGPEPSFGVCVTQAALVYGAPVLTSCGTVFILLHLYLTIRSILRTGNPLGQAWTRVIQFFPSFVYIAVVVVAFVIGLSDPSQVSRETTGMFCHFNNSMQKRITAVAVFTVAILTIVYKVLTAVLLYKNWVAFQRLRTSLSDTVSVSLIVRVSLFGILPPIAGALSVASFLHNSTIGQAQLHLGTAILPTAAAILFGTQGDILHAWRFSRKPPEKIPSISKIQRIYDSPV